MGLCCACAGSHIVEDTEKILARAPIETDIPETANVEISDTADLTIAPDLNRNGVSEEVRLTPMDDGQGQQLEIWENGELVDRETGYNVHTGWTSIFLCTLDGEDYLLRYHPTMYQGVGMYDYALSSLTDNEETVVQHNSVHFDINFGSPVHDRFEPEEIAAFMDEINALLSDSVELLNTHSDLQGTFEKEGRLYDSLWWLDSQEPAFVRDQNKSMLENLLNFQTAMAAVENSAVIEEEEWDVTEDGYKTHYVASEPYGFDSADWTALKTGAQFILYSPNATGHEPGTELYGAWEFQSWMHDHKEFLSENDILGCWGLQNMETGRGFFEDADA